ncbi:MAG: FAD-dependent oxidoreductase [Roseobacter sp.]
MAYAYKPLKYVPPPALTAPEPRHRVAIVGAGPIGLSLAIDLAQRGIACVVLDDNNVVSVGSRAICWAKRSLEIFNRLGVADKMLEKGVTWQVGRQFHGDRQLFAFDLLPEDGHRFPAFINLQQYYVEEFLLTRAGDFPELIDLRFLNKVIDHQDHGDHVALEIETPDGTYTLEAAWMIACDGARSPSRQRMGLRFEGETFDENFLIIDVEMEQSPFGTHDAPERWFWFAPPFHAGQSALLHKQPDNIYRIDLQLGPDADPKVEATEENVLPRIKAIVGDTPFRLDWMSVYRFQCARLARFVHNHVIFAGDSAHVVSPFGARGGNGGIQDIDNLGWKLAAVLTEKTDTQLIASYDAERRAACDENILHATRATRFMTPKSSIDTLFRDEVLTLATQHPFARRLINSGRLSQPCVLIDSPLNSSDGGLIATGSPLIDAPLLGKDGPCWLIDVVPDTFFVLHLSPEPLDLLINVPCVGIGHSAPYPCYQDLKGQAEKRYGRGTYLVRPDGHICAALKGSTAASIATALDRARGVQHAN